MDCDGFPCVVHAKSDAEVLGVRPALQYPNATLLTMAVYSAGVIQGIALVEASAPTKG